MASRRITQREARALRREVQTLRALVDAPRSWRGWEAACGVHISRIEGPSAALLTAVRTASRLEHAVVAIADDGPGVINLYALPLPKRG